MIVAEEARGPESTLGSSPAGPVAEAEHLRKEYGSVVAVADLSIRVEAGEVFGFLGPNGAGKTTTLKMLMGLVTPTSGAARLMGRSPKDPESRRYVGFLPEHFRFPPWLPAGDLLEAHAALAGVPAAARRPAARRLLDRVGLGGRERSAVGTFSKGMQQRLGLAQALIADPKLVFLDEPTSGLDPLGRRLVRDLIRELRASGVAVFLNSHLLGEVEVVCDRVVIVNRGTVVHEGHPSRFPGASVEVDIEGEGMTPVLLARLGPPLAACEYLGGAIRLRIPEGTPTGPAVADAVARLVAAGVAIHRVMHRETNLEDVFLTVVGESEAG